MLEYESKIFVTIWQKVVIKKGHINGKIHHEVQCPNCGSDMTELEYVREEHGKVFIWESYRKCPKCETWSKWR